MAEPLSPESLDALLQQDLPFRKLRKHFSSRNEALQAYADYHATLNAYPPPDVCCLCRALPDVRVQYTFQASALGPVQFSREAAPAPIQFWTFHSYCRSCYRRARVQRFLAAFLHFVALLLGVIGAVIGCVGFTGIVFALVNQTPSDDLFFFSLCAALATFTIGTALGLNRLIRRLRFPPALRRIRRPFRYAHACREKSPGKFPLGPTAS